MTNRQKLRDAFATSLSLPTDLDVEKCTYGETPGWDSVAHMALVAEIENSFDIMLDTDQVIGMSSFAKAVETVAAHGIAVHAEG
jgi:acyl carrier protein